jgi:hypothetical protein
MTEDQVTLASPAITAEELENLKDTRVLPVEVPEWKRTVCLRAMGADEALEMEDQLKSLPKEKATESMYILLGATLSTPEGAKLFADEAKARKILGGRDPQVLLRLQEESIKLQGWTKGAREALKNESGEAAVVASPSA